MSADAYEQRIARLTALAEEWRPVVGFPAYEVSSHGRVRGLINSNRNLRKEPLVLSPSSNERGYRRLCLRRDNAKVNKFVQRLVLEAFAGPCPPGMEARHFPDPSPGNNAVWNLSWGTKSQNMEDQRVHGTLNAGDRHYARSRPHLLVRGSRHGCAKLDEPRVSYIRGSEKSDAELARELGVHRQTVKKARIGVSWPTDVADSCASELLEAAKKGGDDG